MELYINSTWTKLFGNGYIAEAIAWSPKGNHATVFAMGSTAEEADAKLVGALRELDLMPAAPQAEGECSDDGPMPRPEGGTA